MSLRRKLVAGMLGGCLGIVAAAISWRLFATGGLKDVTESELREAKERWRSNRLENYRMRIELDGPLQGAYEIKVAEGQPQSMTFNSNPIGNRRTMATWTVEGMFRLLDIDLLSQAQALQTGNRLVVRADFHETLGYPQRYHRHDFLTRTSLTWKVTQFEPARSGDKGNRGS
jgi:hypothetical protein